MESSFTDLEGLKSEVRDLISEEIGCWIEMKEVQILLCDL